MKIFIDTLDLKEIERFNNIISGVTTNPTMARKFGMEDPLSMVRDIRKITGNKEIHVEAFGDTADEILGNTDELLSTGKNLVFKIPFTESGVEATKHLIDMGYKTNLHLVFSLNQALIATAIKSTYICPLVGRLDDIGGNALQQIQSMVECMHFEETNVMVSSVRHPTHVQMAWEAGADAITIPPSVIEQMFCHPLTEKGINTFRGDIKSMMRHESSKTE